MPKTLSKEAEERIVSAVKQAVSLVDDGGLTPDAAIEKVARAEKWGREMIRFASHAYNTGRQTAQQDTGDSVLSKFADFPLADAEHVCSAIWPETVKSAADSCLETTVSSEYQSPPTFVAQRAERQKLAALRAATVKQASDGPSAAPNLPENRLIAVYGQRDRLKAAAEEARHKAAAYYERLLAGMDKLATYFRQSPYDRLKFAEADLAAKTYLGTPGDTLMGWVFDRLELSKRGESRWAAGVKVAGDAAFDNTKAPFNMIQSCCDLAANVKRARAAEKTACDLLDVFTREQLNPFARAPASPSQESSFLVLPAAGANSADSANSTNNEKQAEGLGMMLPAAVGASTSDIMGKGLTGGSPTRERVTDAVQDLEDPAHDTELRTIRTQAMLSDLMNDEVIGNYDPETVLDKYNEISQLAPRTAEQPAAMRSLLRRHLQNNVEPHEIQQVTDLEKGMLSTEKNVPEPRPINDQSKSILG